MKILIVDDRYEDRYLLETILKSAEFQVVSAINGVEALEYLKKDSFELIISDILMPEMDGYMLCRNIRKDRNLCNIPFIFLTATYLSSSDEKFAANLGANDFIKKPVDPDVIFQIIAKAIGNSAPLNHLNKTITEDKEFDERHSFRIQSALKSKSDELEQAVQRLEQTQMALKVSEERYRLISASTSDYVYAIKFNDSGDILIDWISETFQNITGFDPLKINSWSDWILKVLPEDRPSMNMTFSQMLSSKRIELEYRIRTATGAVIWLKDNSSPLKNEKKRVIGRVGAVRDISFDKMAAVRLKLMFTAMESTAESIIITDAKGTIQYVNPAFESISGYRNKNVVGDNPSILKSGKHDPSFYQEMWQTLKNEEVWKGHLTNKKRDGTFYEMEAVISPIKENDRHVTNFICVGRDVTHEKSLESQIRQTQKLEAIGTLAGGIAHDFNNILSAILGFTELSLEVAPPENYLQDNLREILNACHRARDLVKQILTFARQSEHEDSPVQFSMIIKEALKLLRASLPSTIQIKHDILSNAIVMSDPSQLHQIIMNLCTNAAHAMQTAGGELNIKLQDVIIDALSASQNPNIQPGIYVKLTISDTGYGMPPQQMECIFDPFYTTKGKGEGTGLGLSVVHGIVNHYGGDIHVYSKEGIGTTFNIFLPSLTQLAEPKIQKTEASLPKGDECVMIVDDEPAIVNLTTQMLTMLGYSVTPCTSSLDALSLFETQPDAYDIVISDMTMPQMTGLQLIRHMTAIRPNMPAILCSGFAKLIQDSNTHGLNIRAILNKPIFKKELAMTIRTALDDRKI